MQQPNETTSIKVKFLPSQKVGLRSALLPPTVARPNRGKSRSFSIKFANLDKGDDVIVKTEDAIKVAKAITKGVGAKITFYPNIQTKPILDWIHDSKKVDKTAIVEGQGFRDVMRASLNGTRRLANNTISGSRRLANNTILGTRRAAAATAQGSRRAVEATAQGGRRVAAITQQAVRKVAGNGGVLPYPTTRGKGNLGRLALSPKSINEIVAAIKKKKH